MRVFRIIVWVILGILLIGAITASFTVKRVVVHGISMEPTFHDGQTVMVLRHIQADSLNRGDIVVFRSKDGDELIKRVVFVQNLQRTARRPQSVWTPLGPRPFGELFADYIAGRDSGSIPAPPADERIFVMGDNFEHSEDSRDFGPVSDTQLLGKVVYVGPAPKEAAGGDVDSNNL